MTAYQLDTKIINSETNTIQVLQKRIEKESQAKFRMKNLVRKTEFDKVKNEFRSKIMPQGCYRIKASSGLESYSGMVKEMLRNTSFDPASKKKIILRLREKKISEMKKLQASQKEIREKREQVKLKYKINNIFNKRGEQPPTSVQVNS